MNLRERTSPNDALLLSLANNYRQEGYELGIEESRQIIEEKNKEIELLKRQLEMYKNQSISMPNTNYYSSQQASEPKFCYNFAHFPKNNGEAVIMALIDLAESKRERGKYIITTKTDWYMTWKVLHYFKQYLGNEYDFINIVNECVIPYLNDKKRQKALPVSTPNFNNIKADNPMKTFAVHNWRKEYEKTLEDKAHNPAFRNTSVLERGLNIKGALQNALQARGVKSMNFE